jgi:anti-sigma regulatory factor (Ser/Thr protein kinase)
MNEPNLDAKPVQEYLAAPSVSNDWTMRLTLPATHLAVEEFFIEFRRRLQTGLPSKHCFTAELMAREALSNAVQHGCHADPEKSIRCVLRLKGRCLTIVVDDWGEGFDWHSRWDRHADLSATSGRGIEVLRTLATRVRFNDKGNSVTIVKQYR